MRGPGGPRTSPPELVCPAGGPKEGSKSDPLLMSGAPPTGTPRRDPLNSPGAPGRLNGTPTDAKLDYSCGVWTSKTGRPETRRPTPEFDGDFGVPPGGPAGDPICIHFEGHFGGSPGHPRKWPGEARGQKALPGDPSKWGVGPGPGSGRNFTFS